MKEVGNFNGYSAYIVKSKEVFNIARTALREAVCEYGILASTTERDNYRRVWSRDGVIGGIAGLICEDEVVIEGLYQTLSTLIRFQHDLGIIPSNVSLSNGEEEYSLGSLVGRVDATTWFIIGACLLIKYRKDRKLEEEFRIPVQKAIAALEYWEYNAAGLLYTPLSGNWADEYPIRGHTLYDNLLRVWGLTLYVECYQDENQGRKLSMIKEKITTNFWPQLNPVNAQLIYNNRLYKEKARSGVHHWLCFLAPDRFDTTFDAAGNALTMILSFGNMTQQNQLSEHIEGIFDELNHNLVPAFWPPIMKGDPSWPLLAENFSFRFKNEPYNFHNGGIWPVWMGLLALGLCKIGKDEIVDKILTEYLKLESANNYKFSEYINAANFQFMGQEHLTFSASGMIFLLTAAEGFPKVLEL